MDRTTLGLVVMALTVFVFAGLGIRYSLRRIGNIEDFIVARGTLGRGGAFATLVASGIGAWVLFSPAETGSFGGLVGLIGYGLGAAAPLVAFIVLGPRMRQLMPQGHSLTEYVWHRFGAGTYVIALAIILFYMFIFLSAEMTGIALAVHLVVGTPLGLTALVVGLATVAYTAYGGIKASIFTDTIQTWLVIPLLAVILGVATAILGGPGAVLRQVAARQPELLDLSHGPGLEFAGAVIIAILAANMFHQGYWQRVYACRDTATLRRGFSIAALVVIPLVVMPGLFGLMAVSLGEVSQPSTALFAVVLRMMPDWLLLLLLVLGLALAMSSVDTLTNGVASLVATDVGRLRTDLTSAQLLTWSRTASVALPMPAILLAAQGYSVLYLFLIADLVCAAAVFPIFYGMYARRLDGRGALASIAAGLLVGLLFFPDPSFSPALLPPPAFIRSPLLTSFAGALGSSVLVAVGLNAVAGRRRDRVGYDFEQLQQRVQPLGG